MISMRSLIVMPTATSRAAHSSVASLCSISRANNSSLMLATGFSSLNAAAISPWLMIHWVTAPAPAATSHTEVWVHR
jgi:hypothetical protein